MRESIIDELAKKYSDVDIKVIREILKMGNVEGYFEGYSHGYEDGNNKSHNDDNCNVVVKMPYSQPMVIIGQ